MTASQAQQAHMSLLEGKEEEVLEMSSSAAMMASQAQKVTVETTRRLSWRADTSLLEGKEEEVLEMSSSAAMTVPQLQKWLKMLFFLHLVG
jgi:hypothetical protein